MSFCSKSTAIKKKKVYSIHEVEHEATTYTLLIYFTSQALKKEYNERFLFVVQPPSLTE
jgi:hypothetical protein